MRILMLTTNSSLMDGINRHILSVAPVLNRRKGVEVAVCTVMPHAELAGALEQGGVKVYSLFAKSGHDFMIFGRFYKVMRLFRPDIVHIHVLALFCRMVLSVCFRHLQFVSTVHGISDEVAHVTGRMRIERLLTRLFPLTDDATCVVSDGVREYLYGSQDQSHIFTVYNPIGFPPVSEKPHQLHSLLHLSDETPIIGTSCRFAQVKNPRLFTEVMCRVLQQRADVHAVVMGDGEPSLKNELYAMVHSNGVEDRFHWLGYRLDAPQLVRDLNCFILTSTTEGLPTSLLEAMASQVPFAMMEGMGGLKDIAQFHEAEGPLGIVVPRGDVDRMAKEVAALLSDATRQKALSERAYKVAKQHFEVECVCTQLLAIYRNIMPC